MNTIIIQGYVTQDSITKSIGAKNTQCLNFRIGVNNSFKNERGNIEKKAMFFDVSLYGAYAEYIQVLKKGALVIVQGKLNQDVWEKDGQKYSKVGIVAHRVYPINKQNNPNSTVAQQQPQNQTSLNVQEIKDMLYEVE